MNCSFGEPFVTYIPMKSVVTSQALLSLFGLIINPFVLKTVLCKMYFHRNIRILLGTGIVVTLVHALIYVFLQSIHSYLMLTAKVGCDVMVSPAFCNVLRTPAYFCTLCYSAINNGMVFERLVATVKVKTYEEFSVRLGAGICVISFVGAFAGVIISLRGLPTTEYVPYCSLFNSDNARQISVASFLAIVAECAVLLLFVSIFLVNKWMEKNQRFNVKSRFQVRENLTVCRTLAPWIACHFVMVFVHATAGYLIPKMVDFDVYGMMARTVLAGTYMMPLFSVVSPLALLVIYKQEQIKRRAGIVNLSKPATSEQYFLAYTAHWNPK